MDEILRRLDGVAEENRKLALEVEALRAKVASARRAWRGAIAVGVVAAAALAVGGRAVGTARAGDKKVVEAQAFVVKDDAGVERASLHMWEGVGPTLSLNDKKGAERIQLCCSDDGLRCLRFLDTEGKERVLIINQSKPLVTGMTLYDKAGKERAWLTLDSEGSHLVLNDKSGNTVFSKP